MLRLRRVPYIIINIIINIIVINIMFEAVRRRLETGGSTELQEGFLGRWVASARDKVHHLNEFF